MSYTRQKTEAEDVDTGQRMGAHDMDWDTYDVGGSPKGAERVVARTSNAAEGATMAIWQDWDVRDMESSPEGAERAAAGLECSSEGGWLF